MVDVFDSEADSNSLGVADDAPLALVDPVKTRPAKTSDSARSTSLRA